jgi:hypothetical protein
VRLLPFVLAFLFAVPAIAQDGLFGTFVGDVITRWLPDGRGMELLENFLYVDPRRTNWVAPKGSVIDGASIPQWAWSIIGGPYDQKYRNASVIHDVACQQKVRRWEDVHEAFYNAMRASGVGSLRARLMYAAVYHFGPRWPLMISVVVPNEDVAATVDALRARVDQQSSLTVSVEDHYVQGRGAVDVTEKIPTGLKRVSVTSSPSAGLLTWAEFAKLGRAIEEQDLTLEQIREFVPP